MATEIPLRPLDRTALPPSRAAAAKPPLALADRTAEISLALAGAKFAGDTFNDIVQSIAANEEAAFEGTVAAEMEGFNTFVKSNPGASFEKLEDYRTKTMIPNIETAGRKLTTKRAKQSAKQWMLRNKPLLLAKTQTQMEAIRSRQAQATFNAHRENLINGFKETELASLYTKQVAAGLLTPEFAKAQLADDLAVIDEAERKVALGNIQDQIVLDPVGMKKILQDELDARKKGTTTSEELSQILPSNKDIDDLIDFARTEQSQKEADAKVNLETAIETEKQAIDDIFILPRDEFLGKSSEVMIAINQSEILTVKDKEQQRAKINKRIDAIKGGKIDPVTQFDPKAYDDLSIRIARNSKAVKSTDISNRVGLGKNGGLTTKQSEELTRLKKFYDGADVLGNSLHRTYTSAITGLKTAKRFSRNKTENIQFAAQARNVLDAWAVQNPDATESDYQDFFDRIIDNSRMNTWTRGWFTRKAEEDRISIRENIEDIQRELAGETQKYQKGDTRIIGGVTYTFNGKTWTD